MQSTNLEMTSQQTVNLDELQLQRLSEAVRGLTQQQLHWASGYLVGLSQIHLLNTTDLPSESITILYASHTGNGRGIAEGLSEKANSQGIKARVLSVADFKPRDLLKEKVILLIVSTQGEGEAPESSLDFHHYLFGKSVPELNHLNFSVFALGDSSYEHFCQAGKDFDLRLEQLGAKRLLPRVDADVNYEADSEQWSIDAIKQSRQLVEPVRNNVVNIAANNSTTVVNKKNPYPATLLEKSRISTEDSETEVYHLELQIDPQILHYKPGDALGVWSHNSPELVAQIVQKLSLDADQIVSIDEHDYTVLQALEQKLELTQLHPSVIKHWNELTDSTHLKQLILNNTDVRDYAQQHQFIDLIEQFPAEISAEDLIQLLQPLQPRLYSISSSQLHNEDEIHLTVSALRYKKDDQERHGTASCFLADRIEEEEQVSIYVAENTQFRLPENNDTPIIMVAAGTGIAPFRAFLQQRQEENASGKNWLIFGNRNFRKDFLYQLDWQKYRQTGLLNKINLAFSRDTSTPVYVQDQIREQGDEIYHWLNEGAHFYICGSTAVEQAVRESIIEVLRHYGEFDQQSAEEYVENLRSNGRYLRDVY